MPLSPENYAELLRYIQTQLREVDPDAFGVVANSYEMSEHPKFTLISYLTALTRVMRERSGGSHGYILNRLNSVVRLENGGPVKGLRVQLSPEEQDLYHAESVSLASLPDRSKFVQIINEIRDAIIEEEEPRRHDQ